MILNNIILITNKEIKKKRKYSCSLNPSVKYIHPQELNITYPMIKKVQPTFKPLSVTRHVSRISPTIKRDHSGIIIISGNRSSELKRERNASLNHVILFPVLWTEREERERNQREYLQLYGSANITSCVEKRKQPTSSHPIHPYIYFLLVFLSLHSLFFHPCRDTQQSSASHVDHQQPTNQARPACWHMDLDGLHECDVLMLWSELKSEFQYVQM